MNQHSEKKRRHPLTRQNSACYDGCFFSCLDGFCVQGK